MFRRLTSSLTSSVGQKALMGITGLLLVGFLVFHLAGNTTLYFNGDGSLSADSDGGAFDAYVEKIKSFGPLLVVARIGLFALFAAHIALAFRLSLANREARHERYALRGNKGALTVGSASMLVTGSILLVYLLKHLYDFSLDGLVGDGSFEEGPAADVQSKLSEPATAMLYILGIAALTLHLTHGFRSAFQSLGANHPQLNAILKWVGLALALALGAGFLSFPVLRLLLGS